MSEYSLFTSESVSEGHPDKIADQISDAVLDAIIAQDKYARVACETLVRDRCRHHRRRGHHLGLGRPGRPGAQSHHRYRLQQLRRRLRRRHLRRDEHHRQAVGDIAQGVDRSKPEDQGAGDQGLMFGYASNETEVLMPAPICFSHRLVERQAEARKSGLLPWLRPDAKSQVTCRYERQGRRHRRSGTVDPAQP